MPPPINSGLTNRRVYLYAIVSVLVFLAVIAYNRATRPTYTTFSISLPTTPREITSIPNAAQADIFRLLGGISGGKANSWLSTTKVVDADTKTTKFRNYIAPMNIRKVNVAPYLSEASVAEAKQIGIVSELVVAQRPSLNSQLLPLLCELRAGLEPKAPKCDKDVNLIAALDAVKQYAAAGYGGLVDPDASPLPSTVVRGKGVGFLRSYLGSAVWEQQSSALLKNYRYALTSATKLPLWMCTGQHGYWKAAEIVAAGGGSGMGPVTWGVDATLAARQWNKEIAGAYLQPLKKLLPTLRVVGGGISSSDASVADNRKDGGASVERAPQNGLASEMLLKKVRVWSPLSAPLTETNVQDVALRPSLVCVILTIRSQVKTAMLQHILWGHQCDEFVVMYTIQDHEEAVYGDGLSEDEVRLVNQSGIRLDHVVKLHSLPPLAALKTDGYNLAWYRYRQACEWLDYWPEFHHHSYFYFATESVYAIPENIYALLLAPEYRALHSAGTPLYAGNRMVAEVSVGRLHKDDPDTLAVPYIHSSAGVLLSATTIRLMAILLEAGSCADGALTGSPDIFLAQCLASTGVAARDTADVLGEDRFHPLTPVEMLAAAATTGGVVVGNKKDSMVEGGNKNSHAGQDSNQGGGSQADDEAVHASWWLLRHKPKLNDPKIQENPLRMVSGMSAAFGGILTPEQMVWMHRVLRG